MRVLFIVSGKKKKVGLQGGETSRSINQSNQSIIAPTETQKAPQAESIWISISGVVKLKAKSKATEITVLIFASHVLVYREDQETIWPLYSEFYWLHEQNQTAQKAQRVRLHFCAWE